MKCSTWSKDSHGLFDYESSHTTDTELAITTNCKIIRKGIAVEIKEGREDLDKTAGAVSKGLANIGIFRGKYWVYDPAAGSPNEAQEQLWLVLRNHVDHNGQPGIKLQQGDIIKMGRCKYLVKELITDSAAAASGIVPAALARSPTIPHPAGIESKEIRLEINLPERVQPSPEAAQPPAAADSERDHDNDHDHNHSASSDTPEMAPSPVKEPAKPTPKDDEIRCRICLGDEVTETNPLISSPCKCMGTVKLIHAECLQQWLRSKVVERKADCVTAYSWKQFECDVCKTKYPRIITCPNGKVIEIFRVQKPEAQYMILQTMNTAESNAINNVYVISLNKKDTLRIV